MDVEIKDQEITYSAGGLVWRNAPAERDILRILSCKDRSWKLPKGHIQPEDLTLDADR